MNVNIFAYFGSILEHSAPFCMYFSCGQGAELDPPFAWTCPKGGGGKKMFSTDFKVTEN